MKSIRLATAAAAVLSGALLTAGPAAADDYTALLIDPNVVVDTLAYTPGPVTTNPGGQPGAAQVFTHRDGRSITDSVWVLTDSAAAAAAATAAQTAAGIADAQTEQVAVGTGGTFISGRSADGSQALAVLTFTQGTAAAAIEFAGPANDPADATLATEIGQAQDALIRSHLGG